MRPESSFDGSASVALWPMLVLIPCLILSGCVSTDGSPRTPEQIAAQIERQCAFVTTATSIAAILGLPGAPAADKLAQVVCKEIENKTRAGLTAPGQKATVEINGVPLTGTLK